MYLLELIMPFATRTTFVKIRKDILVITTVANCQFAIIIRASVKDRTVTNATFGSFGTGFSITHLASEVCVGMSFCQRRVSGNDCSGET